jgi:PAS domain S-box-containing protein
MDISSFFTSWSTEPIAGTYIWYLVALSYLIAVLASYVALDITEQIRTSGITTFSKYGWLVVGAFSMGLGIWTMHFIGMLAFVMQMPMQYDPFITILSMIVAVIASGFAFFLIKNDEVKIIPLAIGGIFLGLGIVSMHYIGMSAMLGVHIQYIPIYFILSIIIAIAASEAALWLMIKSSSIRENYYHRFMKIGAALIMGFAICGMHYTGMYAAIFAMDHNARIGELIDLGSEALSFYLGGTIILIMLIALATSRFWMGSLKKRNQDLIDKEEKIRAILTAAADGIIVTDEKGKIEICNRAASSILNYPSETITSKNVSDFFGVQGDTKKFEIIPFAILLKRKDALLDFVVQSGNKKKVPIELSISQVTIGPNKQYIIVFRDISERKAAEGELASLNKELQSSAHTAGMAEVANCVLHNIGNALNSVNITVKLLMERMAQTRVEGLKKLIELLNANKNNLSEFIRTDQTGKILPEYLSAVSNYLEDEKTYFSKELSDLNSKIEHIKSIIAMQQSISGSINITEKVDIHNLLEDALAFNNEFFEKNEIHIRRDYAKIPPIFVDKVKTMQALINILKNASESLMESKRSDKKIIIKTRESDSNFIYVEITDNGIGIKAEDIKKVFSYGFTTKKAGHGFGLHSSALNLQQVGGSLKAYSSGVDRGATFILTLPKEEQTATIQSK